MRACLVAGLVLLAMAARLCPTDAAADVVVLSNRTADRVACTIVEGPHRQPHAIEPGAALSIPIEQAAIVEFASASEVRRYQLEPNSAYFFYGRPASGTPDGELELEQIGLAPSDGTHADRDAPAAREQATASPASPTKNGAKGGVFKIPVKVLVDDDERAARSYWERRLRSRVEAASRIVERHCGIGFEVVAAETWVSSNAVNDFERTYREFEEQVEPRPARLAIGFTRQYAVSEGRTSLGASRVPLASHMLLREWPAASELEQIELLVHKLGHYLGADHSPERSSVMRPALGDRQAVVRGFRIGFDPLNTLALALVAEELRSRDVNDFAELSPATRRRLDEIHATLARAMRRPATDCYVFYVPGGALPPLASAAPARAPAAPQRRAGGAQSAVARGSGARQAELSDRTPLSAVSERFAAAASRETPQFRRHVLPLLGRLGCNGRACHGSFQGQGGFRLSLFGYDFDADHRALTDQKTGRIDRDQPAESLILQKPTLAIDHGGGRRLESGTWHYGLLLRWIESGAPGMAPTDPELIALEIEPREIVFESIGETEQLNVVALWSDGTREDVTPICRYRTSNEDVAAIDESGLVTALGRGDTYVVAFYDHGVAPAQVLVPVSELVGPDYPDVPAPTRIDELVLEKLRKLGIVPSELSSDEEFLRRVSLDMTGTLPTPEEIVEFASNPSQTKRAEKIDELLASPAYAAWWTTRMCDFTGNSEQNNRDEGFRREQARQWFEWIYRRVNENMPYDELVAGIVLATSRGAGQSFDAFSAEMTSYVYDKEPADFSLRETMPHFWASTRFDGPKEMALGFSYAFLGVRLQCAECHKHPFDLWTKEDFEQFTAFFRNVKYGYTSDAKQRLNQMNAELGLLKKRNASQLRVELARQGRTVPWREVYLELAPNPNPRMAQRPRRRVVAGRVITPKLLGGDEVIARAYDDPRGPVMDWMRQDDNPYFARALVNRIWANYFNVGIIEPPDDLSLANSPSNPELLEYLAQGFIARGFDMKWVHREVTNSRTYQLSWRPNETNRADERNFSRCVPRRLPAEVLLDALLHATAADGAMQAMHRDMAGRAIGPAGTFRKRGRIDDYFLPLFGKPARTTNCDCERSSEPTLLQTVFLRNDPALLALLDRQDGWLRQLAARSKRDHSAAAEREGKPFESAVLASDRTPSPAGRTAGDSRRRHLIREAYLRTLCREPADDEAAIAMRYLAESDDLVSGMRDVLWALVNTKEFIVNR